MVIRDDVIILRTINSNALAGGIAFWDGWIDSLPENTLLFALLPLGALCVFLCVCVIEREREREREREKRMHTCLL